MKVDLTFPVSEKERVLSGPNINLPVHYDTTCCTVELSSGEYKLTQGDELIAYLEVPEDLNDHLDEVPKVIPMNYPDEKEKVEAGIKAKAEAQAEMTRVKLELEKIKARENKVKKMQGKVVPTPEHLEKGLKVSAEATVTPSEASH